MKRFIFGLLFAIPLVSACGGGGGSISSSIPQGAVAPPGSDGILDEGRSDAERGPSVPFAASSSDLLYVGNAGNNSITVYRTGASGDAAPLYKIAGSKTKLDDPGQLSEDAAGNLYVANGTPLSILVFAHGANGNVAPIRVLAGSRTGFGSLILEAMTVDRTTGKIFAMVMAEDGGESSLLRFPPNASGNEAPFAESQGDLVYANQIDSDSTGRNIIEANSGECCNVFSFGTDTLPKQFYNGAQLQYVYEINAAIAQGVADDPTTKTYLASIGGGTPGGIYRFAEDTNGNFPYQTLPASFKPAVVSVITSDTCGRQMTLGYQRSIYVVHNAALGGCPADAVYVYEHDASGNARPIRILSGAATELDQPNGIFEGK